MGFFLTDEMDTLRAKRDGRFWSPLVTKKSEETSKRKGSYSTLTLVSHISESSTEVSVICKFEGGTASTELPDKEK